MFIIRPSFPVAEGATLRVHQGQAGGGAGGMLLDIAGTKLALCTGVELIVLYNLAFPSCSELCVSSCFSLIFICSGVPISQTHDSGGVCGLEQKG